MCRSAELMVWQARNSKPADHLVRSGAGPHEPAFERLSENVPVQDLTPLVGAEVRRVCFDYQVTLDLVDGPALAERVRAYLQIEAPVQLRLKDRNVVCDPNDKTTHGPLTALLHLVVSEATVGDDSALRLQFDDGTALTVERDGQYESWNLTGDGVPHVLMGPE